MNFSGMMMQPDKVTITMLTELDCVIRLYAMAAIVPSHKVRTPETTSHMQLLALLGSSSLDYI